MKQYSVNLCHYMCEVVQLFNTFDVMYVKVVELSLISKGE